MSHVQLSGPHKQIVTELYAKARQTADNLPYTDEFEQLRLEFEARSMRRISPHAFWHAILGCRKAGRLVRKER